MLINMIRIIKDFLLNLFFPCFCLGCQKEGVWLCQDCLATLDILENFYCLCIKNPRMMAKPGKCKKCHSRKLSGLYFALPYQENPLTKNLIQRFKYPPYLKDLSGSLSALIIKHFLLSEQNTEEVFKDSALVPIPLDKNKIKRRGFNQAEEIAENLSEFLKIPLVSNNLIKIKKTLPQVGLSEEERQENLKGAFFCKAPEEIKGNNILLVDDVYTTGATMEECARVLKKSGAKEIWGIVIARES